MNNYFIFILFIVFLFLMLIFQKTRSRGGMPTSNPCQLWGKRLQRPPFPLLIDTSAIVLDFSNIQPNLFFKPFIEKILEHDKIIKDRKGEHYKFIGIEVLKYLGNSSDDAVSIHKTLLNTYIKSSDKACLLQTLIDLEWDQIVKGMPINMIIQQFDFFASVVNGEGIVDNKDDNRNILDITFNKINGTILRKPLKKIITKEWIEKYGKPRLSSPIKKVDFKYSILKKRQAYTPIALDTNMIINTKWSNYYPFDYNEDVSLKIKSFLIPTMLTELAKPREEKEKNMKRIKLIEKSKNLIKHIQPITIKYKEMVIEYTPIDDRINLFSVGREPTHINNDPYIGKSLGDDLQSIRDDRKMSREDLEKKVEIAAKNIIRNSLSDIKIALTTIAISIANEENILFITGDDCCAYMSAMLGLWVAFPKEPDWDAQGVYEPNNEILKRALIKNPRNRSWVYRDPIDIDRQNPMVTCKDKRKNFTDLYDIIVKHLLNYLPLPTAGPIMFADIREGMIISVFNKENTHRYVIMVDRITDVLESKNIKADMEIPILSAKNEPIYKPIFIKMSPNPVQY